MSFFRSVINCRHAGVKNKIRLQSALLQLTILLSCATMAGNSLADDNVQFDYIYNVELSGKYLHQIRDQIRKVYEKDGLPKNPTEEQKKIILAAEKMDAYILGVADSTEGKSWCGYYKIKSPYFGITVYEYIITVPAQRLKERAAKLIEEALIKKFPCKK
jgi:Rap1a immunity proteins